MKQLLLSLTNTVTPEQSCTNIFHSFQLEQVKEELEIRFSYLPKVHPDKVRSLEIVRAAMPRFVSPADAFGYGRPEEYLPIVNLLTLSLEDPAGYRGCAHRHDDKQVHYINENYASPGFYRGKLPVGAWRVCVNLHCVVTDSCTYALEVWAGEGKTI